jgi:glycosyltransferase involved in cell wall biosynthesis
MPHNLNVAKDRLRVWQIAELYPPDYGGGAAVYIRDVCRFLAGRGHEVRVLCTEGTAGLPYSVRTEYDGDVRIDRLNLPYFRGEDPGGWRLNLNSWRKHEIRALKAVESTLGAWSPDLVQFHTPYTLLEECLPLIRGWDVPTVGMAHCAWLVCPRLRLIKSPTSTPCRGPSALGCLECLYTHWDGSRSRGAMKLPWRMLKLGVFPAFRLWRRYRARRTVEGLIAYSEFMTRAHTGHINGPVQHIPLGVDLDGAPDRRPARPRNPLRFGFAGGYQVHKGIRDVFDAAASLKQNGLSFELNIWGPGQEMAGPEISRLGLADFVKLRGMFSQDERWSAFSEMDVLIMATRDMEPFGRVIQEAAAVGAPTIAPDIAGIAEQIRDGVDGLLYRFKDKVDLERQMARVIVEPGLVSKLSRNLWSVVDTKSAVDEVEVFYRKVLAARGVQSAGARLPIMSKL